MAIVVFSVVGNPLLCGYGSLRVCPGEPPVSLSLPTDSPPGLHPSYRLDWIGVDSRLIRLSLEKH